MTHPAASPAQPTVLPVVLAGGSGTRLWPASRTSHPKQLLALASDLSLFQETICRLDGVPGCDIDERPVVVVNADYRFTIAQQLDALEIRHPRIVLEPAGRNTAPAVTVAALATREFDLRADLDPDPVLLVMPADHVIRNRDAFQAAVAQGCHLAGLGNVVTFGIVPVRPETGYGYIRLGADAGDQTVRYLVGFTEKPDPETAAGYLDSGDYLWNSGVFMMRRSVWLAAIGRFAPAILSGCETACAEMREDGDFVWLGRESFLACPSDSIDYAVMEHLPEAGTGFPALVVPLDAGWSDVGAWDAWWAVAEKDPSGNALRGDVVAEGCRDTLVRADHRTVVTVGCEKMVVVESADAVLVTPMDAAQGVKDVVTRLVAERPEITLNHRRVHRPWGSFDGVDAGDGFQVKHIVVDPGASISLQFHRHRAEHWVVVRGTAQVTRGDEVFLLEANQSTYVPVGTVHRLANPGETPLEIIEIQSGDYLGEDDIVRLDDPYGRETG